MTSAAIFVAAMRTRRALNMVDANHRHWPMTITNPKVFTNWTMTSAYPMARQITQRNFDDENTCHEGNVDLVHLKNVYDQAHGPGVSAQPK